MDDVQAGLHENLGRIANRWTALVVQALASGTKRYSELRRELGRVSHKMLSQTLRGLERDGIVERTVHPVVPPKVEYTLTPLGQSLVEPLVMLCEWTEQHRKEIEAARARYAAAEQTRAPVSVRSAS
jgi:DNA-binding HxlR family transcriptional regulator